VAQVSTVGIVATMKSDPPYDKSGKIRRWFSIVSPIIFFAVWFGVLCAFYDYFNQYFNNWSFSQRLSHVAVLHDSEGALVRRFLYGASGGSILGVLIVLRSREKD
jgi:hypothetical protein